MNRRSERASDGAGFQLQLEPGNISIVSLTGDVDPPSGPQLEQLLFAALAAAKDGVVVDLTGVGLFGSGAIRAFDNLMNQAELQGKFVRLLPPPRHIQVVFDAVGLDPPLQLSAREQAGRHLLITGADFEQIVSLAVLRGRDSVCIMSAEPTSPDARIVFVNRAFTDLTGYSADEAIGQPPKILEGPLTGDTAMHLQVAEDERGTRVSGETVCYAKDGTPFVMSFTIVQVVGPTDGHHYWVAIQTDRTEARRLHRFESALTYLDAHERALAAGDESDRYRLRVESMLAAQVALMEGGRGAARLVMTDGRVIETPGAGAGGLSPSVTERLRVGGNGPSVIRRLGPGDTSALIFPLTPPRNSGVAHGTVMLCGMEGDRLRLADPMLHAKLANYALR